MNKAQKLINACEDKDEIARLRAKRDELAKKRRAIKVTAKSKGETNPAQDQYDSINKQIDDIETKLDSLTK
jgi:hypothetical protein